MKVNKRVLIFIVVILIGLSIGTLAFKKETILQIFHKTTHKTPPVEIPLQEYTYLKIFFPLGGKLQIFEKRIKGKFTQTILAEILMKEFLSLNDEMNTGILPTKLNLLNAFISSEAVLYLNFPSAFSRGFRGDVMDEYLLLKGILDTMISNLNINDVVILINGREIETLGGHFFLNKSLKQSLSLPIS